MATRIRLSRFGAKKQPSYRVIVSDSRCPRDGRFVEILGSYNPRGSKQVVQVDAGRVSEWLKRGAIPSDGAREVLRMAGVLAAPAPRQAAGASGAAVAGAEGSGAGGAAKSPRKEAEPGGSSRE